MRKVAGPGEGIGFGDQGTTGRAGEIARSLADRPIFMSDH